MTQQLSDRVVKQGTHPPPSLFIHEKFSPEEEGTPPAVSGHRNNLIRLLNTSLLCVRLKLLLLLVSSARHVWAHMNPCFASSLLAVLVVDGNIKQAIFPSDEIRRGNPQAQQGGSPGGFVWSSSWTNWKFSHRRNASQ